MEQINQENRLSQDATILPRGERSDREALKTGERPARQTDDSVWVMDAAPIDIRRRDGARPWLTFVVDVNTRLVCAFEVGDRPPTTDTLVKVVRKAVSAAASDGTHDTADAQ